MGCHFLLQEIFPTQGSTPRLRHLLHWQVSALPLSSLGSTDIHTQVSVLIRILFPFRLLHTTGEELCSSLFGGKNIYHPVSSGLRKAVLIPGKKVVNMSSFFPHGDTANTGSQGAGERSHFPASLGRGDGQARQDGDLRARDPQALISPSRLITPESRATSFPNALEDFPSRDFTFISGGCASR